MPYKNNDMQYEHFLNPDEVLVPAGGTQLVAPAGECVDPEMSPGEFDIITEVDFSKKYA
jgi:hypothetical protein